MSINEQLLEELNNIYQLTYNLYINKLNVNDTDIDVNIDYIQTQIYNVNKLKHNLDESLYKLNKIKQIHCKHQYKYDNINYEPMQLVCIKCNKIVR